MEVLMISLTYWHKFYQELKQWLRTWIAKSFRPNSDRNIFNEMTLDLGQQHWAEQHGNPLKSWSAKYD